MLSIFFSSDPRSPRFLAQVSEVHEMTILQDKAGWEFRMGPMQHEGPTGQVSENEGLVGCLLCIGISVFLTNTVCFCFSVGARSEVSQFVLKH